MSGLSQITADKYFSLVNGIVSGFINFLKKLEFL